MSLMGHIKPLIHIAALTTIFLLITSCSTFNLEPFRGNYTVVAYKNGNVFFYQSGDESFSTFPRPSVGFSVVGDYKKHGYNAEKKWDITQYSDLNIEKQGIENKCEKVYLQASLSKIEYGKTPLCFEEKVAATELEKGKRYYISEGYVPEHGNDQRVYFELKDCADGTKRTCLVTNSPLNIARGLKRLKTKP